jgi:hypothetical protein
VSGAWAVIGMPGNDRQGSDAGAAQFWQLSSVRGRLLSYGDGWPGAFGVPQLTADHAPAIGSPITIIADNSALLQSIPGWLVIGFTRASIPTGLGGTLLVIPALVLPVTLPALVPLHLEGSIPDDPALVGSSVMLQLLEADPGASRGVSFTPGLELVIGEC